MLFPLKRALTAIVVVLMVVALLVGGSNANLPGFAGKLTSLAAAALSLTGEETPEEGDVPPVPAPTDPPAGEQDQATNAIPHPARHLNYMAAVSTPGGATVNLPVAVQIPAGAERHQPVRVLVALHGMGGNGEAFAQPLFAAADRYGWIVVAPTFAYSDWHDPNLVRGDATDVLPELRGVLQDLPQRIGLQVQPRVLLYGFSRGAQTAHRFALFYPEMVDRVAALSAGTYTLPEAGPDLASPTGDLRFPFGMADIAQFTGEPFRPAELRQVRFWIGVGSNDHRPGDVPRVWDGLIGNCRVDRASSFAAALQALDVSVEHVQFANTAHVETDEMRSAALAFLSAGDGLAKAP